MKCAIFDENNNAPNVFGTGYMEGIINEWLASNPDIRICHLVQSSTARNCTNDPRDGQMTCVSLTVFYED